MHLFEEEKSFFFYIGWYLLKVLELNYHWKAVENINEKNSLLLTDLKIIDHRKQKLSCDEENFKLKVNVDITPERKKSVFLLDFFIKNILEMI